MQNNIESKEQLQKELSENHHFQTIEKIDGNKDLISNVADRIPGIIFQFVLRVNGTFAATYICERAHDLLGLKREDILSDPSILLALIKNEEIPAIRQSVLESAETLDRFTLDLEIRNAGGGRLWLRVEAVPQLLPNKDTIWNGVALDISERKSTEQELLKTKEALLTVRNELEQRVRKRTANLLEANRRLKEEIRERRRIEEEVMQTRSRLLYAQEEERGRIARDLHDGIGQILTGAKIKAETAFFGMRELDPEKLRPLIEELTILLQQAIRELYNIAKNLRPLTLDHLGLSRTIENLCREVGAAIGIPVQTDLSANEKEIPQILHIVIIRILQEGLNNVMKHSRAGHVLVALKVHEDKITLLIHDNGVGFDLEKVFSEKQTMGIDCMKERVRLSGGDLSIISAVDEGATIRAVWPRKPTPA